MFNWFSHITGFVQGYLFIS